MELVSGVGERVAPDRFVVPVNDLDSSGRSVAAEGALSGGKHRVAEDRAILLEIDRRRPPRARPGMDLLSVGVDEVRPRAQRGIEEGVAFLGPRRVDEQPHRLRQRQPRLERLDARKRGPHAERRLPGELRGGKGSAGRRGHRGSLVNRGALMKTTGGRLCRSGRQGNPGFLGNPCFGACGTPNWPRRVAGPGFRRAKTTEVTSREGFQARMSRTTLPETSVRR